MATLSKPGGKHAHLGEFMNGNWVKRPKIGGEGTNKQTNKNNPDNKQLQVLSVYAHSHNTTRHSQERNKTSFTMY